MHVRSLQRADLAAAHAGLAGELERRYHTALQSLQIATGNMVQAVDLLSRREPRAAFAFGRQRDVPKRA